MYFCMGPYHQVRASGMRGLQNTVRSRRYAAAVMPRGQASRLVMPSLVGRMSAVLPIQKYRARKRTTGNRPEQDKRGAPGLDRTADTRFRNRIRSCPEGAGEAKWVTVPNARSEPAHALCRPLVSAQVSDAVPEKAPPTKGDCNHAPNLRVHGHFLQLSSIVA